jgi:GNAT superfamily N-acetyltransferase
MADNAVATNIKIRDAKPHDAPAVAQILHDSFVEVRTLYTEGGFAATTPNAPQVLLRMQEGPVWVASGDHALIGTVAAVVKGEFVYIRGMAVLPSSRGGGAGVALLRHAEEWAANRGHRHLLLSTTPFLVSAIRLYERAGFARTGAAPHDLFGTPLFTMAKNIP